MLRKINKSQYVRSGVGSRARRLGSRDPVAFLSLILLQQAHHHDQVRARAPLVANRFQPAEAAERSPECRGVCHAFAPTQRQPAPPPDHLNPTRVKSCMPTLHPRCVSGSRGVD